MTEMTEKLTPERAVRLLRAKAAELEALFRTDPNTRWLATDIALVASILADFMETAEASRVLYEAHTENLIERVYALEGGDDGISPHCPECGALERRDG